MAIDLSTNSHELKAIYDEICNTSGENNWAIFGYAGKTNTLKVATKGEDGLEECIGEFNSGQVQYGFVRVQDPNHQATKFVLINWQGEGAPIERKGSCANHQRDVAQFFHGAHVSINARSDADLDAKDILKLVAKSSGAAYSNRKEERKLVAPDATPSGPVGTNYKNEFASKGLADNKSREEFWSKQEQDDKRRKEEEEARRREAEKAKVVPVKVQAPLPSVPAAAPAPAPVRAPAAPVRVAKPPTPEPEPEPEYQPEPEPEPQPEPEPEYQAEPAYEEPVQEEYQAEEQPQEYQQEEYQQEYQEQEQPQEEATGGSGVSARALYDYQASEDNEITFDPDEIITDIEQVDEGWWQGRCRGKFGLFPANYVELI